MVDCQRPSRQLLSCRAEYMNSGVRSATLLKSRPPPLANALLAISSSRSTLKIAIASDDDSKTLARNCSRCPSDFIWPIGVNTMSMAGAPCEVAGGATIAGRYSRTATGVPMSCMARQRGEGWPLNFSP